MPENYIEVDISEIIGILRKNQRAIAKCYGEIEHRLLCEMYPDVCSQIELVKED